jgi:malonyl-CoA/methylmalonyl-CoA synthetase
MAVPTIYRRLVAAWESSGAEQQRQWSAGAGQLRLMVSGSAALPVQTLERWEEITGHRLLERYGMTEIGMALGNPLHGERRAGTVGQPFSGVEARLVDEQGEVVPAGEQGEIEVRGEQVFSEYWGQPEATRAAFRDDDWFRTGDEAVVDDGYWRIVGRRGVDIIKTGGYKVSALEIEATLRQHPGVADVAVVGIADEEWGERVCAALVPAGDGDVSVGDVRDWCKERLAPHKVPKDIRAVDDLPRNAMGKVVKPQLRRLFTGLVGEAVRPPA